MKEALRQRFITAIKKDAVLRAEPGNEFILASGAKSKVYIDFSRLTFTTGGIEIITDVVADCLERTQFNAIGGPSSGADPIVGSILRHYFFRPFLNGFVVRKEAKGRGPDAGELISGCLHEFDHVVLIEDVTTSGVSVMNAIKAVEAKKAKVCKVISLLDRQAGADKLLKDYDFVSIVKLSELHLVV